MVYNRPQSREIEAILIVADLIAKYTQMQFVVDNAKRDEFIWSEANLSSCAHEGFLGQSERQKIVGANTSVTVVTPGHSEL